MPQERATSRRGPTGSKRPWSVQSFLVRIGFSTQRTGGQPKESVLPGFGAQWIQHEFGDLHLTAFVQLLSIDHVQIETKIQDDPR